MIVDSSVAGSCLARGDGRPVGPILAEWRGLVLRWTYVITDRLAIPWWGQGFPLIFKAGRRTQVDMGSRGAGGE